MLHPERRANFSSIISSRLNPEKKILEYLKHPIERSVVVSGNNIPGTGCNMSVSIRNTNCTHLTFECYNKIMIVSLYVFMNT